MTTMPKVGAWGTAQTLKWDAWNRLVEIREGSTLIGQYRYDGLFRRVSKASVEDTYLGNIWQTRHYYYNVQWQVIEERLNTEASAARQFVWGARYRDDLILRDRSDHPDPDSSSEEPDDSRLYVTHDQWHVTSVLQPDGTVFERYAYDAFGQSIVLSSDYAVRSKSICSWETRYGAYRFDSESRLYQVRFRYVNPALGAWVSRDPIGMRGGLNLYAYVGNDPTASIDLYGLDRFVFDGKMICRLSDDLKVCKKCWEAVSGKPSSKDKDGKPLFNDFSKERQGAFGVGPLPEGEYDFPCNQEKNDPAKSGNWDTDSWNEYEAHDGDGWKPWKTNVSPRGKGPWGNSFGRLEPQPGTNTRGRKDFNIHGGKDPGSAGCIDIGVHDSDFFKEIRNDFNGKVQVTVDYSGNSSKACAQCKNWRRDAWPNSGK
jgi:RHS repeat-associated protein